MLSFETTGMRVYKEFVDERLKPNSTKSINEPIKKVMRKTCKLASEHVFFGYGFVDISKITKIDFLE